MSQCQIQGRKDMLDSIIGFLVFFVIYYFIVIAVDIFGAKVIMKIWGTDIYLYYFFLHIEIIFIVSAGLALVTPTILSALQN